MNCYSRTNSHLCKCIDIKVAEFSSIYTTKCDIVDVLTFHQHTVLISLQYLENLYFKFEFLIFGLFLIMLVIKTTLLICFLCVGFSRNWLNADKGQNCEKVNRSIPPIFLLPVVVRKYCYLGNSKQVPPQLKLKNLLLLLCGDVAVNPGPTNFRFVNCRSICNKGPFLHDLIQRSDLDILGLVETHIRPTDTDGLLNSLTSLNYNLIQKPRCTGLGGGVGFMCRKSFSPSIVSSPVFRSFEIIILSFRSDYNSFVAACVFSPPGSCTINFWKIFWLFVFNWFQFYHLW